MVPSKDESDGRWSSLEVAEIDEIEALQRRVYGTLVDRTLFKPAPPGFFNSVLTGRGSMQGFRLGGRLVAFGTLLTGLDIRDRARERLGLAEGQPLAMMQGAVVDPECRGRRLHRRLLQRRLALLRPAGLWHVYATAAPGNVSSWRNMLAEGYEVADVSLMYGRLLRYTLYRPPRPAEAPSAAAAIAWCDPLDVQRQEGLLASGRRGRCFALRAGSPAIGYS